MLSQENFYAAFSQILCEKVLPRFVSLLQARYVAEISCKPDAIEETGFNLLLILSHEYGKVLTQTSDESDSSATETVRRKMLCRLVLGRLKIKFKLEVT